MAVRATQGFTCKVDGKKRRVSRGDVLASNDPVVKGRKNLFEPIVEQATAAPGEQRGVKKTAAKKSD